MEKNTNEMILLAEIVKYYDYDPYTGELYIEELPDDERFRLVVYTNGKFIDLNTAECLERQQFDCDGNIISEIYANTSYITELYKLPELSEEQKEKINNKTFTLITEDTHNIPMLSNKKRKKAKYIYQMYLEIEKLKQEGKIIQLKQKRLY